MAKRDTTRRIRLRDEFNQAADLSRDAPTEPEKPAYDLEPPSPGGPDGPGLGGGPSGQAAQLSPQLRDDDPEPPKTPILKKEFNKEATKGVFKQMFNRKAREQDRGVER